MIKPGQSGPGAQAESIPALFRRAVDEGKSFARAEVNYYKQLALARVAGLQTAAILVVVAIFFVQASLTTLVIGVGVAIAAWLGGWLGLAGSLILAAILGLALSGILARVAIGKIKAAAKEAAK